MNHPAPVVADLPLARRERESKMLFQQRNLLVVAGWSQVATISRVLPLAPAHFFFRACFMGLNGAPKRTVTFL